MPDKTSTFQRTLEQIFTIWPDNPQKRGEVFEKLMVTFFKNDPVYMKQFRDVQRWSDWAKTPEAQAMGLNAQDQGIDIVGTHHDGRRAAIQCKCYKQDTALRKKDIDSFIAEATKPNPDGLPRFHEKVLVDTGAVWSDKLEKNAREHSIRRIGPEQLDTGMWEWPDINQDPSGTPRYVGKPHTPRPHQEEALQNIATGFTKTDRGQLVMACGTGKTLVALRTAEDLAGNGKTVLYLVPSISLLAQTIREFAIHGRPQFPLRYLGICSDKTVGRRGDDPDMDITEVPIEVTTSSCDIVKVLAKPDPDAMTVVFSTYQSLPTVAEAMQDPNIPDFAITFCDEAHRTAGLERSDKKKTSPFQLIHDNREIRSIKRLYMTATPRIYRDADKTRIQSRDSEQQASLISMDDEQTFGSVFHYLTFGRAVDLGLLTDYRVVIFIDRKSHHVQTINKHNKTLKGKITKTPLDETTLMAAVATALDNPEDTDPKQQNRPRAQRVIAFTNSIQLSKYFAKNWFDITMSHISTLPVAEQAARNAVNADHVDGRMSARERNRKLEWLAKHQTKTTKILSNARCLAEGVDVPALDGIVFTAPKRSPIEIIQAVGRVMRTIPGKDCGYIVVPVTVPEDTPQENLFDEEEFNPVWQVLRALRSHDERLTHEIHKQEMPHIRIIGPVVRKNGDTEEITPRIPHHLIDIDDIRTAILEKCGDRAYWKHWAAKLRVVYEAVHERTKDLYAKNKDVQNAISVITARISKATGTEPTEKQVLSMVAQHKIIIPVFNTLFQSNEFTQKNPIAMSLEQTVKILDKRGLAQETDKLRPVYDSIRSQVKVNDTAARQQVFIKIFQDFIKTVFKEECKNNGVEYTPIAIVDFMLHSIDELLQKELSCRITNENVHLLDPYAGTGSFIVRLIEGGLIEEKDLTRKFLREIHANEVMLLPYYIACANIEQAYQAKTELQRSRKNFSNMLWTDTLAHGNNVMLDLFESDDPMRENKKRYEQQNEKPIRVVFGNPPFNVGDNKKETDNQKKYPAIARRIEDTYVRKSLAKLKKSLYDLQFMALRHASDRIKEHGVIAFVTNNSWLDGTATSGVRAVLRDEFDEIHVVNLKGRYPSKDAKAEGGSVFGIKVGIALAFLVRKPHNEKREAKIYYHDIGHGLKAGEKLERLEQARALSGLGEPATLNPDRRYNWLESIDEKWWTLIPLTKEEENTTLEPIFELNTNGQLMSPNDNLAHNFSRKKAVQSGKNMANAYNATPTPKNGENPSDGIHLKWSEELINKKVRGKTPQIEVKVEKILYRPFLSLWCYQDPIFIHRRYQTHKVWPSDKHINVAIGATSRGALLPFSSFATKSKPDNVTIPKSLWFPRYIYPDVAEQTDLINIEPVDNVTDKALTLFQKHYEDLSITKDDIFHYVYGILHAQDYREKFAVALIKERPRIPLAPLFHPFAKAGAKLLDLHTAESVDGLITLNVIPANATDEDFRLNRKMKISEDATEIAINDKVKLTDIPPETQKWKIGGQSALWYLINYLDPNRKQYFNDNKERISDPNDHFTNPRDIVRKVENVVNIAIQTLNVIEDLPPSLRSKKIDIDKFWPVIPGGSWPPGFTVSREQIYDKFGRLTGGPQDEAENDC